MNWARLNFYKTIILTILLPLSLEAQSQEKVDSLLYIEAAVVKGTDRGLFSGGNKLNLFPDNLGGYPRLMGQSDIMRVVKTLPGVLTNKESSTGLLVQGCEAYHSIVSINGAPIFSPDHLFGLYSAFITAHFSEAVLTTGHTNSSFPDRLGGSLEFRTFPNKNNPVVDCNISLLSSDATVRIPISERTTMLVSGRKSYLNELYGKYLKSNGVSLGYGFYDTDITISHIFKSRDSLVFTAYRGRDRIDLDGKSSDEAVVYGNGAASLRWTHNGRKVRSEITARLSEFSNHVDVSGFLSLNVDSRLWNMGVDFKNTAALGQWGHIMFGSSVEFSSAVPFVMESDLNKSSGAHKGVSYALFGTYDFSILPNLIISPGLRLSGFSGEMFSGKVLPIVDVKWSPLKNLSVGIHYGHYIQYLHRISLFNGGIPADYWILPTKSFKPETERSYSVSLTGKIPSIWNLSFSVEGYFRTLDDLCLMAFNPSDLFYGNISLDDHIYSGSGRNLGMDVSLRKETGTVKGYLTYSLSKSDRFYPQISPSRFPSPIDRLHNLNAVIQWRINSHWLTSAVFSYISGTPYTSVDRFYLLGGMVVPEFGEFYGSRLPDNHHLDVSVTYRIFSRFFRELDVSLSVYNVYMRKNVQFLHYSANTFGLVPMSYIGFPLPSLNLHFKF